MGSSEHVFVPEFQLFNHLFLFFRCISYFSTNNFSSYLRWPRRSNIEQLRDEHELYILEFSSFTSLLRVPCLSSIKPFALLLIRARGTRRILTRNERKTTAEKSSAEKKKCWESLNLQDQINVEKMRFRSDFQPFTLVKSHNNVEQEQITRRCEGSLRFILLLHVLYSHCRSRFDPGSKIFEFFFVSRTTFTLVDSRRVVVIWRKRLF